MCIYTLSVSVFYCIWLPVLQSSCWYLRCSSLLTFKLISAYLLSEQLLAFWSVRSLDNASKLKSFVNPIAWLLESHWELFNINGEGLPDFQSHFLFIIQARISTSCFLHRDNTLLLNCLTQHRSCASSYPHHCVPSAGFKSKLGPSCEWIKFNSTSYLLS